MTPKMQRALQALLTNPTKQAAAAAAGVDHRTISRYLRMPEFQQAYKAACCGVVSDAAKQAQQALNPALTLLLEIVNDPNQSASARISAARSLLEYGLRLTEFSDILRELEAAEGDNVL